MKKIPLVVLAGPTAVGKTELSVQLALALNGEIISADSMQFYRYMDIGTAKITKEEMCGVPHHFIDIVNPDENYTVADFQSQAKNKIDEIISRGHLPIVVGGTALYVNALIDGYTLQPQTGENPDFRIRKSEEYETLGGQALWEELAAIDPVAAAKLHVNDKRRIIRALEVYHLTGKPASEQSLKTETPYCLAYIVLTRSREHIYERIEKRVDIMLQQGLENEVKSLLEKGYGLELKPMGALGYKQIGQYLQGEISYETAVELIKRDTRRFAKRQLTWWRRDERINWFDVEEYDSLAALNLAVQMRINELLLKDE